MNSDDRYWALIMFFLISGIVLTTLITISYWKDHNTKIVELIKSGVDPIAALCAMQDDYGNNNTCIILATKHKEK